MYAHCFLRFTKGGAFSRNHHIVTYYKRNMYAYQLGVHHLATDKSYMYVWNETIGSRGSQEIASSLAARVRSQANDKKYLIA